MRAISLYQPWAELVRRQLKRYETRGWKIDYRGVIAIHAGKQPFRTQDVSADCRRQMLWDEVDPFTFSYGAVLCFAEIVDCVPTFEVEDALLDRELIYGDYAPGRWAWKLENVVALEKPIPLIGHQGIYHWRDGQAVYEQAKAGHAR